MHGSSNGGVLGGVIPVKLLAGSAGHVTEALV